MASPKKDESWKNDNMGVQRGDYGVNIFPTLLFTAGRLATGPLQLFIVSKLPLMRYGFSPPPTGGMVNVLGLNVPRLHALTALMPAVLSLKNTIWGTTMAQERMTLSFAVFAIVADAIYESIATTIFTVGGSNPLWSEQTFYTGMTIYFGAIALEIAAEIQRIAFKKDPKNKGKLCTTGFWGITRHINYTANVFYGFGYGLATGGPLFSIPTAGMYLANFITNAIPSLEGYCAQKYGQKWEDYQREVSWKLLPGIY